MGVSVERLKRINDRLKSKIAQKEASNNSANSDNLFTIDVATIDDTLGTSTNGDLLNQIPAGLRVAIEIDEKSDNVRLDNIVRMLDLYKKLDIEKKAPDLSEIFVYKAMNISGIGLKEEDFGEIREGKYVQIIAITYEPDKNGKKKAKNISLGYFGKAETLDKEFKNEIIEFVLRWRYEKAFQNLKHYRVLLARLS